jgi:hypothetical protein
MLAFLAWPRNTLAGVRVAPIALLIPQQAADIEIVAQYASTTRSMSSNRRVTPGFATRPLEAFLVEASGNCSRRLTSCELSEDATHSDSFAFVDLAVAANWRAIRGAAVYDAVAIRSASA